VSLVERGIVFDVPGAGGGTAVDEEVDGGKNRPTTPQELDREVAAQDRRNAAAQRRVLQRYWPCARGRVPCCAQRKALAVGRSARGTAGVALNGIAAC
jgi:hypothetical protein